MTSGEFRDHLDRRAGNAGLTVEPVLVEQLEAYFRLLTRWNAKVNLTAFKLDEPTDEAIDRLLIEPLAAARLIEDAWTPWFDVGSGGGSPAIPLKLSKPHLRLTMVESRSRKAAFLREAVRSLELSDAVVELVRFEELAGRPGLQQTAGLVSLRGVRADESVIATAARILRHDGRLVLFRESLGTGPLSAFGKASSTVLVSSGQRSAYLAVYPRTAR